MTDENIKENLNIDDVVEEALKINKDSKVKAPEEPFYDDILIALYGRTIEELNDEAKESSEWHNEIINVKHTIKEWYSLAKFDPDLGQEIFVNLDKLNNYYSTSDKKAIQDNVKESSFTFENDHNMDVLLSTCLKLARSNGDSIKKDHYILGRHDLLSTICPTYLWIHYNEGEVIVMTKKK